MKVATARARTQFADIARSRALTLAAAGVVVIGTVAALLPPVGSGLGSILERAHLGMKKPATILAFSSPLKLRQHFSVIGYDLDTVRAGAAPVPRIFLARVPNGLADVQHANDRKDVFLRVMLPLILEANERVQQQRAQLLVIDAKLAAGQTLTGEQLGRLDAIAAEYGLDSDRIDLLLRRVDAVPPSLALAQAAIESGWGTSRFVLEGNAVFGQWAWGEEDGLVPLGREQGKTHKIKSFQQLTDSVRAYVHNLNTHNAYRAFREKRLMLRAEGKQLTGISLVPTLTAYSEMKGRYLELLRGIITANDLQPLDGARLHDGPAPGTDA
jgi:Bax protein